jgi:hypothetical protein
MQVPQRFLNLWGVFAEGEQELIELVEGDVNDVVAALMSPLVNRGEEANKPGDSCPIGKVKSASYP